MDNPESTPIWYGIGEGSEVEIDPERKVELLAVTAYPKTHNNKNEENQSMSFGSLVSTSNRTVAPTVTVHTSDPVLWLINT